MEVETMDFGTGWLSGTCEPPAGPSGWFLARLEPANPIGARNPVFSTRSTNDTVVDSWSAAAQWWMTDGHLPARPIWNCRACEEPWPCQPSRAALIDSLSRGTVSVVMAEWMHLAAGELNGIAPGMLFDRFLLWTRQGV